MADFEVWALGEASITVSVKGDLDSFHGREFNGLTITLNNDNFESILLTDNDNDFDDDDGGQRTDGQQTFDGQTYSNHTRIEAEYTLTLRDPATGLEYKVLGLNLDGGRDIEGLTFVDEIPPVGVALDVINTTEGPGRRGTADVTFESVAVPCFTPGTMIDTPDGPRAVEKLAVGDMMMTIDNGPQPLIWTGHSRQGVLRLARHPNLRPIEIKAHAFGLNHPNRDMMVSPQHRILIEGWRAEVLFGKSQVLVAAKHLVNDTTVRPVSSVAAVTYIHLQCARHEVLISDGLPTESFNPGPSVVGHMAKDSRAELQALFPDCDLLLHAPLSAARPILTGREARAWVA